MQLAIRFFTLAALLGCYIVVEVTAYTHIVGGSHGWRVPKNLTYFEEWAKLRTFGVGDRLVFPSRPMGNNVVMVSKEDFGPCTQDKVLDVYYEGPLILNLTHTGDYYFYNGVGKHCEAGQKLHISVGDKEGSSGDLLPFKLYSTEDEAAAPTTTALPDANKRSSATAIQSISGISVGLLTLLAFLLI